MNFVRRKQPDKNSHLKLVDKEFRATARGAWFKRVLSFLFELFEEILLFPCSIIWRLARRRLTVGSSWDLYRNTAFVFRFFRRLRGRYQVWKDRRYRGNDEFHSSLDMNVSAMLTMSDKECLEYRKDLMRRREQAHIRNLSN